MEKETAFNQLLLKSWCCVATLCFVTIIFWSTSASMAATQEDLAPGRKMAKQKTQTKERWITTDHSKHELLKQEFTSGPQVTKACLSCHTEASLQFHKTIHWTWMDPATTEDKKLGKGGLSVNNF
jgi:hypothetical protein